MEIEFDEGYIITIDNGKEYLLIQRVEDYFFAVEMLDEENTSNNYIIIRTHQDTHGGVFAEIVEEF